MEKDSLLDKIIFWFKNNKFFSIIILLSIVIVALANVFNSVDSIFQKSRKVFSSKPTAGQNTNSDTDSTNNTSKNTFATIELQFGGRGTGVGKFTNPISIGVDKKGIIYVGESAGRIQAFDTAGNFITEWNLPAGKTLGGIAVSRNGIVYASDGNGLFTYEGETGKYLGFFEKADYGGYSNIAATADGSIIVSISPNGDIIRLNDRGAVTLKIENAIERLTGGGGQIDNVIANGTGDIYAISDAVVYKFSSTGKFVNKFGGKSDDSDQPGQLSFGADVMAVDSKGRIFVLDFINIKVFDADGRYITEFENRNDFNSLIFNDKDELYGVTNDDGLPGDKVIKFRINDTAP